MVLANVSDSVIATDLEGIITFWNEGATRLFGWNAAEMVGRPYADRFPEPERSWIVEQVGSRAAGTEWVGEYQDLTGTARGSGSMPASDRSRTRRAGRRGSSVSRGTSPNASGPRSNWPPSWPASRGPGGEHAARPVDGDSTPLLHEILDAAIAITAADMGTVQLLDPETDTLRLVASRGLEPRDLMTSA